MRALRAAPARRAPTLTFRLTVVEAWQGQLLAESMHHHGVYIGSKFMLIDPLCTSPLVLTGSANFSTNSSTKNGDQNQLFVVGERDVTDVSLGEFMRLPPKARLRTAFFEKDGNAPYGCRSRAASTAASFGPLKTPR